MNKNLVFATSVFIVASAVAVLARGKETVCTQLKPPETYTELAAVQPKTQVLLQGPFSIQVADSSAEIEGESQLAFDASVPASGGFVPMRCAPCNITLKAKNALIVWPREGGKNGK